MNFKNLFLVLTSILVFSCSSDGDNDLEMAVEYDSTAKISEIDIEATNISVTVEAKSTENLAIGLRRKGESEFKEFSIFQLIDGLSPAQEYEVTILVRGQDSLLFPIRSIATKPFDYLFNLNSETSLEYVNSALSFKHEGTIGYYEEGLINFNEKDNYNLLLVDKSDDSRKIPLAYEIKDNKINFEMPNDLVPEEPYSLFKSFLLAYQIGDSEIGYIEQFQNGRNPLVFVIQNPTPQINEISSISTVSCQSNIAYEIIVRGHFMNNFRDNLPYYYESSTLFMTDVETGKEIILVQDNNSSCISYKRFFAKESITLSGIGLSSIHSASQLTIKYLKTDGEVVFTSGRKYKMKVTFSNTATDFFETNEIEFVLP